MTDELAAVRLSMDQSDLASAAASVRQDGGRLLALGDCPLRALSNEEIALLESLANSAEDWTRIRVAEDFDGSRIRGTSFRGDVVLGRFTDDVTLDDGIQLPAGIEASTVINCVIGHNAGGAQREAARQLRGGARRRALQLRQRDLRPGHGVWQRTFPIAGPVERA